MWKYNLSLYVMNDEFQKFDFYEIMMLNNGIYVYLVLGARICEKS